MRTRLFGLLTLAVPAATAAQNLPSTPPGRNLFVLDLAGTPLDEFPSAIKALSGTMTVVDRDGRHMLRASSPSDFLITLPQALPADFTVEVDLIPKACCNPEDFMLEGTPTRNRGVASAELTWQPAHIMAVGGGAMYQSDMPADLAASTPGSLTRLVWEFSGTTIKHYTNGRRLYTLDKQFTRGRVLRVWLGGQDEGVNGVYLAGLRVMPGAVASGLIAQNPAPPGAPTPPPGQPVSSTPTAPPGQRAGTASGTGTQQPSALKNNPLPTVTPSPTTAQSTSALTGTTSAVGPTGFMAESYISPGSYGILLQWNSAPNAASYRVYRGAAPAQSWTMPGVSAQVVPVIDLTTVFGSGGTGPQAAMDVDVIPGSSYVYWVDAVFADGSASLPSVTLAVNATATYGSQWSPSLRAVVSSTSSIQVTGLQAGTPLSLRGGTAAMPGSNVTWTWNPAQAVFRYDIQWRVVENGVTLVFGRERVDADMSGIPSGPLAVAPVTKGIPAGKTVEFCIAFFGDPDLTKPLPPGNTCVTSTAPVPPAASSTIVQGGPISPRGTVTVMSNGPPPYWVNVTGAGARADVAWAPPSAPGSFSYTVNRALAGTTSWTLLTPAPIAATGLPGDQLPDPTRTYTYQVRAIAPDGTFGVTSADYTPPPFADPSGFTAKQVGPDEVELRWVPVSGVQDYRIVGPGAGNGITVPGTADPQGRYHRLTGIPVGSHTWTIASVYQPGGVLTASTAWPKASVAVAAFSGRYRVTMLGFEANRATYLEGDDDGRGDEVYLAAFVASAHRVTGTPDAQGVIRSVTYGDVAGRSQRLPAGTLSPEGGLKTGDAYPLSGGGSWPVVNPQKDRLPMLLWEGALTAGADVLIVQPALWESDVDAKYGTSSAFPEWSQAMASGAAGTLRSQLVAGEISQSGLRWIAGPAVSLNVSTDHEDHPIGMQSFVQGPTGINPFSQPLVVLTQEKVESVLSAPQTIGGLAAGIVTVPVSEMYKDGFYGHYTLYLRVERVP